MKNGGVLGVIDGMKEATGVVDCEIRGTDKDCRISQ